MIPRIQHCLAVAVLLSTTTSQNSLLSTTTFVDAASNSQPRTAAAAWLPSSKRNSTNNGSSSSSSRGDRCFYLDRGEFSIRVPPPGGAVKQKTKSQKHSSLSASSSNPALPTVMQDRRGSSFASPRSYRRIWKVDFDASPPPPLVLVRDEDYHVKEKSTTTWTSTLSSKLSMDQKVALVYFCAIICNTLPCLLVPHIAAHHSGSGSAGMSLVAGVSSLALMGGGTGKLLNGMVCHQLGGIRCLSLYLGGVASCMYALSAVSSFTNSIPQVMGPILALQEFFASALWTASCCILSQHVPTPQALAQALSHLSLASASGQLTAKLVGACLLQVWSWQSVAKFGSGMAILALICVRTLIVSHPSQPPLLQVHVPPSAPSSHTSTSTRGGSSAASEQDNTSILSSMKQVVSRPAFWIFGLAHTAAYLARTSDRILAPFFHHVTRLPHSMCGGLTASLTIGLMVGLLLQDGEAFFSSSLSQQRTQISKWYQQAVGSLMGLAVLAALSSTSNTILPQPLRIVLACVGSGTFGAKMAFMFFQLPSLVASVEFPAHKAICLSLLESIGFFATAPIWKGVGWMVSSLGGWTTAWLAVAGIVGVCGVTLVHTISPLLERQQAMGRKGA